MKFLDYFKLALSNLKKKKLRTFINIFVISIGVMFIVTMVSLSSGIQKFCMNKISELNNLNQVSIMGVEHQTDSQLQEKLSKTNSEGSVDIDDLFIEKPIPFDIIDKLNNDDRIDELLVKFESNLTEVKFGDNKIKDVKIAYYKDKSFLDSEKKGLEESNKKQTLQIPVQYLVSGESITEDDKNSVVLSESIVKNTFEVENVEEIIGKDILLKSVIPDYEKNKTFEKKAKIIGVIDQRFFQPNILVSKDILEEVKNFHKGDKKYLYDRGADILELSVKDVNYIDSLIEYVENDLGFDTESVQMVAKTINKLLIGLNIALGFIGIIVVFIASLDIINTMVMSVYERTKSIGIMRSTGASKGNIRNLFLVESAVIGLFGGLLGILLSLINLQIIKATLGLILQTFSLEDYILNNVTTLNYSVALFTIIFVIILSMIAGLYPSIKASRLDPVEALKHE